MNSARNRPYCPERPEQNTRKYLSPGEFLKRRAIKGGGCFIGDPPPLAVTFPTLWGVVLVCHRAR